MSGKAVDINALLDPGPELPSYDPGWKARWDRAKGLHEQVSKREARETSELSRLLTEDLCAAAFARLRFAFDLEEHLAVASAGSAERAGLPVSQFSGSATVEEITARHKAFQALCARVQVYRDAAPCEEWDTGVFRLEPGEGRAREIRDCKFPSGWRSDGVARARLIIERHGADIHVCVLEHPRADAPMTISAPDILAHGLADEFLRGHRGWLRRGPRPRLTLHGIVSSFGRFGGFTQVVEHEVHCQDVREDVRLVQTGVVRRATPLMVREMLEMDQDLGLALRGG